MKLFQILSFAGLLCITSLSHADTGSHNDMPMECKQKHGEMMSPEKKEKMHQMMQMKKKHMQTMEQRLANIEALLKELVELEKKHK